MPICSVDRVRTIKCSMQLISERFRRQWHLNSSGAVGMCVSVLGVCT